VTGSGRVGVTGGALLEFPILGGFADLLNLPALRAIRFQEAEGAFQIKEGRIETNSLELRSPEAVLTISGWGGFLQGAQSPIRWNIFLKGTRYVMGGMQLAGTWKEPKRKFASPFQEIFKKLF